MAPADLEGLLAPIRAEPGATALLFDIDGTLAPIVADPRAAAVPAETSALLGSLTRRYRLVACITGRPALEARRLVGIDGIRYAGKHGFELLEPGAEEPRLDPAAVAHADLPRQLLDGLDGDALAGAGLWIEDKGAIQAIHWRRAADPELAREVAVGVARAAQDSGLVPRWGRRVLEIRPAAAIDKGSATAALVRESGAELALFGGDDETDLDAFRALDGMRQGGLLRHAVRVGVTSKEEPQGLREGTDVLVAGPEGFAGVLRMLDAPGP